jgi:hypothetical protein
MPRSEQPWYREGLRFECTRCGGCCRGAGNVWVGEDEIERLASVREMTDGQFRRAYTRPARRGTTLRQKRNNDCVFWNSDTGCEVYDARPKQCRSYPFWQGIVHSKENWDTEAGACPGIGRGDLHPAEEIDGIASDDGIPPGRTRSRLDDA